MNIGRLGKSRGHLEERERVNPDLAEEAAGLGLVHRRLAGALRRVQSYFR